MEANDKSIKDDKVVFVFEKGSQFDEDLFISKNFQAVSQVIDTIMRMNSVDTNRLFFGGDLLDVKLFLTGILNFCYLSDNLEVNQSFDYMDDEDFNEEDELVIDVNS